MKTALCVVDMQPGFGASWACLEGVLREVRLAKKRNAPIIVLEYEGVGPTHYEILKTLSNYQNVVFASKDENDGSPQAFPILKKFNTNKTRIVGVNTCFCVMDTILGLIERDVEVNLIETATNCECSDPECIEQREVEDAFLP
jgi:nicotinamidase-related amidase